MVKSWMGGGGEGEGREGEGRSGNPSSMGGTRRRELSNDTWVQERKGRNYGGDWWGRGRLAVKVGGCLLEASDCWVS